MTEIPRERRGRRARSADAPAPPPPEKRSLRYRSLENPFPPIEILSADQVAQLHASALTVLEEHGIRVLLPEAREVFRSRRAPRSTRRRCSCGSRRSSSSSPLALAPALVRAHRPCARAHRHARRPPSRHGPGQQPARRQRSRRRQALGQPRGLPRPRSADAALRRDARHRPVRRAAGRAGAVPPPAVQPRLPDADRQGAVPLRPRARPGARQLRDVPDRLRARRGERSAPPRAATR